ncbi:MAG TPA: hypothetical protein VJW96_02820 [Terriglobales bacterium]|jgi:hypothetical protein|nr:hypothetical protein [Terriglobales bacterium]
MNQDTKLTVLTTAQRLNLDYWEALMLHESTERVEHLKEMQSVKTELADEFTCLLSMI